MNVTVNKRYGWTEGRLIAAVAFVMVGLLVTIDAWRDMMMIAWRDEEASHIFLVPIVAAWLVWVRRGRFRFCRCRGTWIGPVVVALGWAFWMVGYQNAIQSFWHGGAVMVVAGCLLSVVGVEVLYRFAPAFVVLIFLVPVPGMARQSVALPLQTATAQVTQVMFDMLAIDVERAGNVLIINGVEVAIAEACNGMRMVFALVLVSFAFAFGTPLRAYARMLVLAASPLSAIACNVIRLIPTVWLYGHHPQNVADTFHDVSGWVMLPIAFMALMGILKLLRWAMIPVAPYTLAYD